MAEATDYLSWSRVEPEISISWPGIWTAHHGERLYSIGQRPKPHSGHLEYIVFFDREVVGEAASLDDAMTLAHKHRVALPGTA